MANPLPGPQYTDARRVAFVSGLGVGDAMFTHLRADLPSCVIDAVVSPMAAALDAADPAEFLEREVAALGRDLDDLGAEPVDLVAFSAGCHRALALAARRPDRVRTLTLLDLTILDWDTKLGLVLASAGCGPNDQAVDAITRRVLADDPSVPQHRLPPLPPPAADLVRRWANGWSTVDLRRLADGLKPPLLVVVGELSGADLHTTAAELCRLVPGSEQRTLTGRQHFDLLSPPASDLATHLDRFWRTSETSDRPTNAAPH